MDLFVVDDEPNIDVEFVYDNKNDPNKNSINILFDFKVVYTRAPEIDSDGEEDYDYDNLETRTVCQTLEFEREWFLDGDDMGLMEEIKKCQDTVYNIIEYIDVPCYRDIVETLTKTFLDLKDREAISVLSKVERVKVAINVMVWRFPGEEEEEEDDVDVKLAVAPASDEAVEAHLETVVVENDEGCCVICLDEIKVGFDVAVVRMPCKHLFHRNCGEEWLKNSGICPVCRAVFPSEP